MAVADFNTPTKRERLEPHREPYWFKIAKGRFIGYRKGSNAGSWVARAGKRMETIGNDGTLDYQEALNQVIAWCDREERGGNAPYTLAEAIADYLKYLELERSPKSAKDARGRLGKHLSEKLLSKNVRKLTTVELEAWRNSMVPQGDSETVRKGKDSANRVWSMLRAALNLAYQRGIVDSDRAWRRVKNFRAVTAARILFLTDEEVRRLLDNTEGAFHALCKAAVLTGARYGELASAKVKDLDTGALRLSGKTGPRDCYLSVEAEAFFRKQAQDKLPEAPLLTGPNGGHWKHADNQRPMNAAVKKARLPRETVFYSLRHYHISKAVHAGVSLLAIARNCGTSVKMIEQHYGKFTPKDMRRLMDLVELG